MSKIPQADENTKELLRQIDCFIAKAYSAYIHEWSTSRRNNPRLTLDECTSLQERIRVITDKGVE